MKNNKPKMYVIYSPFRDSSSKILLKLRSDMPPILKAALELSKLKEIPTFELVNTINKLNKMNIHFSSYIDKIVVNDKSIVTVKILNMMHYCLKAKFRKAYIGSIRMYEMSLDSNSLKRIKVEEFDSETDAKLWFELEMT